MHIPSHVLPQAVLAEEIPGQFHFNLAGVAWLCLFFNSQWGVT